MNYTKVEIFYQNQHELLGVIFHQMKILTILIWMHWYGQNIFNYAIKGPDFTIIKSVELLTQHMIINNKPLGAICIAPVMIAKVLQNMGKSGKLTGRFDEKLSSDIEYMEV